MKFFVLLACVLVVSLGGCSALSLSGSGKKPLEECYQALPIQPVFPA